MYMKYEGYFLAELQINPKQSFLVIHNNFYTIALFLKILSASLFL